MEEDAEELCTCFDVLDHKSCTRLEKLSKQQKKLCQKTLLQSQPYFHKLREKNIEFILTNKTLAIKRDGSSDRPVDAIAQRKKA